MAVIADPTNLVAEHFAQKLSVTVQFFHARIISQIDLLINIQWLVASQSLTSFSAIDGADIKASAGEKFHQSAGSLLVGYGANPRADGNPFFKGHIAAFE